jgi:precorrin-8X/cobalt-precorrin-8 methylmutase
MDETALVLIGHGSKLSHNRENLVKIAETLREKSRFKTVEISFMVRNTPTIPEAIEKVVKLGIKKIVLVPAFLAAGVHTTQEIPELIGMKDKESQLTARGIQLFYGEPIGADECVAVILEEKALKALGQETAEHQHASFSKSTEENAKTPADLRNIYGKSMSLIRPEIKGILEKAPKKHIPIIERVVHTTADPEFAKLLVIQEDAVDAGVAAIKSGAKVITDVKMVKAGINESRVRRFGGKTLTYIDDPRVVSLAENESLTRAAASMRIAVEEGMDGAIILIGNAPTAAFELADLVKKGKAKPALIVATPVGYIGAAESKEVIATLPVPFVTNRGRKGGSAVTVAVFNALLAMAEGKSAPEI